MTLQPKPNIKVCGIIVLVKMVNGDRLLKSGSKTYNVGSILPRRYAQRLRDCPHLRKISFKSDQWVFSPPLHRLWNMCTLDEKHCDFRGLRLKFDTRCKIGMLRVTWVCSKTVGLPNSEV